MSNLDWSQYESYYDGPEDFIDIETKSKTAFNLLRLIYASPSFVPYELHDNHNKWWVGVMSKQYIKRYSDMVRLTTSILNVLISPVTPRLI